MQMLKNLREGFLSLIYPNLCMACGENPPMPKQVVCTSCQYYLPKTNFHLEKENNFTDRLWGRFSLHTGAAYYHFIKGGRVQHLIHNLKYNNKPEVGYIIGLKYGNILREAVLYKDLDLIIPVPLHPTKKSRLERLENVGDAFELKSPEKLQGKNILIVDDVLTTGATLESCALKILEIPNVRVSLVTIGIAER